MLLWLGNTPGWASLDSPEQMVLMNFPLLVFALSFLGLLLAAVIGDTLRSKIRALKEDERDDFNVVLNATLTLLGLLIGFSFSMAISRYDQRKNYEEAEANAIGTEYVRADLLPAAGAARVHSLLVAYARQRIAHYEAPDPARLKQADAEAARLQGELWTTVAAAATTTPTAT